MKMFNKPTGKAVCGGVRMVLLAGLTLLLGSCKSWFDDESAKKAPPKKKDEKNLGRLMQLCRDYIASGRKYDAE